MYFCIPLARTPCIIYTRLYYETTWLKTGISAQLKVGCPLSHETGWKVLQEGWRTYGTPAQNGARNSPLSHIFLFLLLDQRLFIVKNMCIYTYLTV